MVLQEVYLIVLVFLTNLEKKSEFIYRISLFWTLSRLSGDYQSETGGVARFSGGRGADGSEYGAPRQDQNPGNPVQ